MSVLWLPLQQEPRQCLFAAPRLRPAAVFSDVGPVVGGLLEMTVRISHRLAGGSGRHARSDP